MFMGLLISRLNRCRNTGKGSDSQALNDAMETEPDEVNNYVCKQYVHAENFGIPVM